MGELKAVLDNQLSSNHDQSTRQLVEDTFTDELIIGLCSPIGTNKSDTKKHLTEILSESYGYEVRHIRLSNELITEYGAKYEKKYQPIGTESFKRMDKLIFQGDELRKEFGQSILVELVIDRIRLDREKDGEPDNYTSRRVCYIIDSLKNSEELSLLRTVYRENFFFFGIYSTLEERTSYLRDNHDLAPSEIDKLIGKDKYSGVKYGQEVQKIFAKSDFFIRFEKNLAHQNLKNSIERFLHLIFDSKVITPKVEETAMYQAAAASRNSACLSRQVGACITDKDGEIISIGWNDVPKFGGSLYQTNGNMKNKDHRCIYWGDDINKFCYNDKKKDNLTSEIIDTLIDNGLLSELKKRMPLN